MQVESCKKYADRNVFGRRQMDGTFNWVTYSRFERDVDRFRSLLSSFGVSKGDRVAVIGSNSYEWAVCAYGVYGRGGLLVPMYPDQRKEESDYIIADSGASVLVLESQEKYQAYRREGLKLVYYDDMFSCEDESPAVELVEDDGACLIYTSGTTGQPKGVLLTHKNLSSNVQAVSQVLGDKLNKESVSLSFLTWAHVFGQVMELHQLISVGGSTAAISPKTIIADLQTVKPTVLVGVPAIYARVYEGIRSKIQSGSGIQKHLFELAMKVAAERQVFFDKDGGRGWRPLLWLKWNLADYLVFSKVKQVMGGRLRFCATGGSKCSAEVQEFFDMIGVPLLEGYGATETSPVLIMERYGPTEHTQGGLRPIPGVSIRICDESGNELPHGKPGEICAAGPNIMQGYWNKPEATKAVFFGEYFRTGDSGIVTIDPLNAGKVITILGRVRDTFKLANGKYVNPLHVENRALNSGYCAQVCLLGVDKDQTTLVVYPTQEGFELLEKKQFVSELNHLFVEQVEKHFEIPSTYVILDQVMNVDNGMLTPKLSVKRHVVREYVDRNPQLTKLEK